MNQLVATSAGGAIVPVTRSVRPGLPALPPEALPAPIEKAAIILTAIGPELAGEFITGLSGEEMGRFAHAVDRLGRIDQSMLDAVIGEFLDLLASGPDVTGGNKAARRLLSGVLDEEQIDRLFRGGEDESGRSVWDRLNDTPTQALTTFLQAEHPQTVAFVISELKPETAAIVLEGIDRELAQTVVLRLSRVPTPDPAVHECVQSAIDRHVLSVLRSSLSKRRPADLIAGLMNNISSEVRDGFLGYLEERDGPLAQDVQRTMFTFGDIALRVRDRDIAAVVRDVEEEVLLAALRLGMAQKSASVDFILTNLPRRLSERYAEEIQEEQEVDRKEGEAAQMELTRAIQELARNGDIRLIDAAEG